MATGNEILAYKGQAELGGGNGFSTGPDLHVLDDFNNTLRQVNQQQFQWNAMKYQQKVQDRNDVLKTMAEQNIDFPIEDRDRATLEEQIAKTKSIWTSTPDIKSNPAEYAKWADSISKFKDLKAMAQARSAAFKQDRQEIADNPDAEDRKAMQEDLDRQLEKGVLHMPTPYQKLQSFDPTNTIAGTGTQSAATGTTAAAKAKAGTADALAVQSNPSLVTTKGNLVTGADGLAYRETTTGSSLDYFNKFYENIMTEAPGKNVPNQIAEHIKALSANKQFNTPENYDAINAKIEAINQANGLEVGNPNRLLPFTDKDGIPTSDPVQFMKDVALMQNYQLPKTTRTLDEDAQKALLTVAQQKLQQAKAGTERATQGLRGAQARTQGALAGKYGADARLAGAKANEVAANAKAYRDALYAKGDAKGAGASAVNEMVSTVDRLYNGKNFKPASEAIPAAAMPDVMAATGIDSSYEIAPVPISDLSAAKMLSRPKFSGGSYNGVEQPAKMYIAKSTKGGINKTLLIGFNSEGQVIKMVNPTNAPGEIIKYENGYNRNKATIDAENAADAFIKEKQGSGASGADVEAIIRNHGVVDGTEPAGVPERAPTTSAKAPGSIPATKLTSKNFIKNPNGTYDVIIGGEKRRVKGRDNTGNVHYE